MTARGGQALLWALGFGLLVIATQAGSLTREVWDWDESTFALLAQDVLNGDLPYTARFDNKPPMLFFLLAGVMAVAGETLFALRLLGDLSLWISAIAGFAILRPHYGSLAAGLAGCVVIVPHTTLHGFSTTAAQPAAACLMVALWALLRHRDALWAVALAGGMISLAVLIRTNLAYVAVAVGLWLLFVPGWAFADRLRRCLIYVLAGLAPLGLVIAIYFAAGAFEEFWVASVLVPLSYAGADVGDVLWVHLRDWVHVMRGWPMIHGGYTGVVLLGLFALFWRGPGRASGTVRQEWHLIGLVALAIGASILSSGGAYPHYWQQVFPVAALLVGPLVARAAEAGPGVRAVALAVVLVPVAGAVAREGPGAWTVVSDPRAVSDGHVIAQSARLVADVQRPKDQIWALDRHLLLFYLEAPTISRVVAHPSNIGSDTIIPPLVAAGYVAAGELDRLFADRPAFLVTRAGPPPFYLPDPDRFDQFVKAHYHRFIDTPQIVVFRRNDHPSAR